MTEYECPNCGNIEEVDNEPHHIGCPECMHLLKIEKWEEVEN